MYWLHYVKDFYKNMFYRKTAASPGIQTHDDILSDKYALKEIKQLTPNKGKIIFNVNWFFFAQLETVI